MCTGIRMVGTLIIDFSIGNGINCRVKVDSVVDEINVMEDNGVVQGVRL